ncbi:MAG: hypothetical protein ABJP79_01035 [Tateyamaria sp.]|uniref:hypothetical protein n=1 Tax=Tateyamaria sp. TaxID=1929288 RepID=UPI00329E0024
MIPSISPHIGMHGASYANRRFNTEQTDKLSVILSNYDTKSLDSDVASKIVTEIKDAGIEPGAGLANALTDNGIDAPDLRDAAGLNGSPGGLGGPPAGGPPTGEPPAGGQLSGAGGPAGAGAASVDVAVVSLIEETATIYEADKTGQTLPKSLHSAWSPKG